MTTTQGKWSEWVRCYVKPYSLTVSVTVGHRVRIQVSVRGPSLALKDDGTTTESASVEAPCVTEVDLYSASRIASNAQGRIQKQIGSSRITSKNNVIILGNCNINFK